MTTTTLYVGSAVRSTRKTSEPPAISVFAFDEDEETFHLQQEIREIDYADWLEIDPAGSRLYAASEVFHWNEGTITAYKIDPENGLLRYLNKQPALGNTTCNLGLSPDGRLLAATNYTFERPVEGPDASVVLFDVSGSELSESIDSAQHLGRGAREGSQGRSHAHCAVFSADSTVLMVPDLGLDKIVGYRVDAGVLQRAPDIDHDLPGGTGPRLGVFHPAGAILFVLNELTPSLTTFRFDGEELHHLSTLPMNYSEPSSPCGLALSPDGRFLYASVREVGEVILYHVDQSGTTTEAGRVKTTGRVPWDLRVTPSGRHLIVGNEDAAELELFRIDARTGALEPAGVHVPCVKPMCIAFPR